MSIRDDMIQKVLGNPGKYSIQQLQAAMQSGSLPAYVVVPIIQDKVQMQKQMQAAMAMQQPPMEQQPPIAQQIMQEAQGVEQLPSNLPQEYAGGGIVAFDDGGMVERYQTGRLVESEEQRRAREAYEEANPFLRLLRKKELTEEEAAAIAAGEAEQQQYYGKPDPSITNAASSIARGLRALVPGAGEAAIPSGMEAEMGGGYQAPPAAVPSAPMAGRQDMMSVNRDMAGGPAGVAGPGVGPSAAPPQGISAIMNEIRALQEQEGIQPTTRKQFEEFAPGFRKTVEGIESRRKAETEKLRGQISGQAYEGLERQLRKEAEEAGADKEQARNMAIFKAGLAMMAGTSRNALENIGKGALVGAEEYQKAAAEIKKAQKENQRMLAHIDQARRAEKRGDVERQIDELDKASARELKVEEYLSKGLFEAGIKDEDTQRAIFKDRLTVAGQLGVAERQAKSREDVAALRAELGGQRGALTEYQKQMLLAKARAEYPIEKARMELAKSRGWSEVPKPGKDTKFDKEVERYWTTKYHSLAGLPYDSGAAAGGAGPRKFENFEVVGVKNP